MTKKILNLYAGIGGNRKLWDEVMDVDVTAVEIDEKIGKIYQDFFPNDEVIVTDAHSYLEEHFGEYDFIWSSPPCPTHSRIRKNCSVERGQNKPKYPDMELYEEILFLEGYFEEKWVVENVKSWYDPLIEPQEIGSHYYWSNFIINGERETNRMHEGTLKEREKRKGFDLSKYKGINKKKILRNCVEPEFGKKILECAYKKEQKKFDEFL